MTRRRASVAEPESVATAAADLRAPPPANGKPSLSCCKGGARGLMRLSWNEVRVRAATFAEDWKDARGLRKEKDETQSFYNAFFDVFGMQRRNVARCETHVEKLDSHIDLFWPGVPVVEYKNAGRDLKLTTRRPESSISTRRPRARRATCW